MSTPDRDQREVAIDAVAKRMIDVDDDADLARRIVGSLPERRRGLAWLIPQLAMASAVVVAAFVWISRDRTQPPLPPLPAVGIAEFAANRPPVGPVEPEPVRTAPLAPVAALALVDHERSLPPVEGPGVLTLRELTPFDLPATTPLALPALEIAELPMTAESFSPRD